MQNCQSLCARHASLLLVHMRLIDRIFLCQYNCWTYAGSGWQDQLSENCTHCPGGAPYDNASKEGWVPVQHQRIVCGTQQLDNGATLQYRRVVDGTMLHLVSRLRGGRSTAVLFVDVSKPGAQVHDML